VQALNAISVLNPNISHVAIDGALFPQEVEARQVMAVPTVFLNGEVFGQGRMNVEQILARLDSGAHERAAEKTQGQGAVRRARRRRRSGRCGGGNLCRAQRHSHRTGGRAFRRPGAGHHGDRKLHLGALYRRPEARRGAGGTRAQL